VETKSPDVVSSNSNKKFQFQEPKNNNINNKTIKVNLSASQFKYISYDIFEVNNKWFKNLSNAIIPWKVKALLQLGENFCLPTFNIGNTMIIKHIEHNFVRLKLSNIKEFRNRIFSLIKRIKQACANKTDVEKRIFSLIKTTKAFVKNNPHIIFTRADKGNVVVALDKTEYV